MGNKETYYSDFLFPKSSVITGMGTIINIWGNFYTFNSSQTPEEADKKALECDWGMVGKDIKDAAEKSIQPNE